MALRIYSLPATKMIEWYHYDKYFWINVGGEATFEEPNISVPAPTGAARILTGVFTGGLVMAFAYLAHRAEQQRQRMKNIAHEQYGAPYDYQGPDFSPAA